jgi:hypothetical protein
MGLMTLREAEQRAREVWDAGRIFRVTLRSDGGADVWLTPPLVRRGPDQKHLRYHRLDADGRAVCHPACADDSANSASPR